MANSCAPWATACSTARMGCGSTRRTISGPPTRAPMSSTSSAPRDASCSCSEYATPPARCTPTAICGCSTSPMTWRSGRRARFFVVQGHGRGEPKVIKFDKDGNFIKAWGKKGTGAGEFDIAHSIAIDAQGLLYVADRNNQRIQVFDADGTYLRESKAFRNTVRPVHRSGPEPLACARARRTTAEARPQRQRARHNRQPGKSAGPVRRGAFPCRERARRRLRRRHLELAGPEVRTKISLISAIDIPDSRRRVDVQSSSQPRADGIPRHGARFRRGRESSRSRSEGRSGSTPATATCRMDVLARPRSWGFARSRCPRMGGVGADTLTCCIVTEELALGDHRHRRGAGARPRCSAACCSTGDDARSSASASCRPFLEDDATIWRWPVASPATTARSASTITARDRRCGLSHHRDPRRRPLGHQWRQGSASPTRRSPS